MRRCSFTRILLIVTRSSFSESVTHDDRIFFTPRLPHVLRVTFYDCSSVGVWSPSFIRDLRTFFCADIHSCYDQNIP